MYNNAKLCVRQNHQMSNYIYSNNVVRQGDNLSPNKFLLFLNDLVELMTHGFDGLPDITEAIHLLCDNDVEVHNL